MSRNRKRRAGNINSLISACTSNAVEEIQIPKVIEAHFREDFDILHVNKLVVAKILRQNEASGDTLLLIKALKRQIGSFPPGHDVAPLLKRLKGLENKYLVKSDPNRLERYREASKDYLEAYVDIGRPTQVVDIMSKRDQKYSPTSNDILRIFAIKEYLDVASNYIKVNVTCTGELASVDNSVCEECGTSLLGILIGSDGSVECPECPSVKYLKVTGGRQSENDCGTGYEDLVNFVKGLHRYQGKIVPKVNMEEIKDILDAHFAEIGLPTSDQVISLPVRDDNKKDGTSVQTMLKAMQDCGIKCYSDVYYICNYVWGWLPFDVSHIEETVVEDYKKTQKVWYLMPQELKNRESSLPMWYRICQHLRLRGHKCIASDFKMPKNVSGYNESWKYMCENSGDPTIIYEAM